MTDAGRPPIKIFYLIDYLNVLNGGTEGHLHALVTRLDPRRFRTKVIPLFLGSAAQQQMLAEEIDHVELRVRKPWSPAAWGKALTLRKLIRRERPDIVQTFHFKADTFGVIVSRLSGVPHIVSSRRDTGDRKTPAHVRAHRLINPWIDRFISVCDRVGETMAVREAIPDGKWETIYNGVDLERYHVFDAERTAAARGRLGFGPDDFVVGMVAYFRREKNHDVLFDAAVQLRESIPGLKLLLVGDGPLWQEGQRRAREAGLDSLTRFAGRLGDVRDHVAAMDVACLIPGSNEGLSNAVLQEMAMGRPMIVTDVGGNAELVVDGDNGIVIPPLDVPRLTQAILRLWHDPGERLRMGRNSRLRVERHFTDDAMIRSHERFYEALAGRTARADAPRARTTGQAPTR